MENFIIEEKKASLNGFEVPIECIHRVHKDSERLRIHYHEYIELLYGVDECDIELWCNGKTFSIKRGELVLIPSRSPHIVKTLLETSNYIVIKIMPQILYASEQSIFETKYLIPFIVDDLTYKKKYTYAELESTLIPNTIKSMINEWDNKKYGFEIALRINASQIILWFLRKWHVEMGENIINTFKPTTASTIKIQKIIEYINANYATANAKEAAKICNMSYNYFTTIFKSITQKKFTEYVNHIRITESERLLISTDKSITDIAMEIGFSTTSYYIECFKNQLHITPKQYRKNYINNV